MVRNSTSISANALLKPVTIGGVAVAGWPILAVAASVMVLDSVAQREQRAHHRVVESLLKISDNNQYSRRIATQLTTDKRLSSAISRVLDGREPVLDVALQEAGAEFHLAVMFLEKHSDALTEILATHAGKPIPFPVVAEALGGPTKDVDRFARELGLARASLAIQRKAILAEAATAAIADPENPYRALRQHLERESADVHRAEELAATLDDALASIELKVRWHDKTSVMAQRQSTLRAMAAIPEFDSPDTLQFVALPTGEIYQLESRSDAATSDEADPDPDPEDLEIAEPEPPEDPRAEIPDDQQEPSA